MKITTDGTPVGTKIYDDSGEKVTQVVAVQRVGRNTYVTVRARDCEVEGIEGDFHLAINSGYQPVRVG